MGATCFGLLPVNHYNDFTLGLVHGKVSGKLTQSGTMRRVVELGNFTTHRGVAVCTAGIDKISKGSGQAQRRLIDDKRARICGELCQTGGTPFFLRQKTLKYKPVTWKTGVDQRRNQGSRPGKGFNNYASGATFARKHEARIRYAGSAGIAHQRHSLTGGYAVGHGSRSRVFIELMMADHRSGDVKPLHQHGTGAGIFSQNQISAAQHFDGTRSHVTEIAHRSGNYI